MSYDDHGLFFISVSKEYEYLDADLRLVLPHLVSGESENPHKTTDGKHLVMVALAADVVQEGQGYFWQTLEEAVGNLWPNDGNFTKRVKNLVKDEETNQMRYGEPMDKSIPVDNETQAAADRIFDALPTEWFPGECPKCGRITRGSHRCPKSVR